MSNGWWQTSVAPVSSHGTSTPPNPAMLTSGNGDRMTSSAVSAGAAAHPVPITCQLFAQRGTAFGAASVPDVQHSVTASDGCLRSRSTGPGSASGARPPAPHTSTATPVAFADAARSRPPSDGTVTIALSPATGASVDSSCSRYAIGNSGRSPPAR